MSDDLPFTEFPVDPELVPEKQEQETEIEGEERSGNRLLDFWKSITDAGLANPATRIGTHIASIALVLLVVWLMPLCLGGTHAQDRSDATAGTPSGPDLVRLDPLDSRRWSRAGEAILKTDLSAVRPESAPTVRLGPGRTPGRVTLSRANTRSCPETNGSETKTGICKIAASD